MSEYLRKGDKSASLYRFLAESFLRNPNKLMGYKTFIDYCTRQMWSSLDPEVRVTDCLLGQDRTYGGHMFLLRSEDGIYVLRQRHGRPDTPQYLWENVSFSSFPYESIDIISYLPAKPEYFHEGILFGDNCHRIVSLQAFTDQQDVKSFYDILVADRNRVSQ